MPRYEFVDGGSSQFWDIRLEGTSFTTTYGRLGSAGRSSTKEFDSDAKAQKEYDKLVAEKVKKGYALVGAPGERSRDEDDIDTVVTSALVRKPAAPAPVPKPAAKKKKSPAEKT